MNISEIKELIKAVSDSELTGFDLQEGNVNISLRKGSFEQPVHIQYEAGEFTQVTEKETAKKESVKENETSEIEEQVDISGNIVKSPLVGTAYMAPEEGAEPFVKVGDTVKKGQTLAIVEAMKLMNEIESEYDGVVKQILVENGQTVEYAQEMFVIG